MTTKKSYRLTASIILIILLSGVCATSAFDLKKDEPVVVASVFLYKAKNSDDASIIFWNWLLKQTKLTARTAAMHNIYQQDTAAVFYDLDDDGKREILGTHHASAIAGAGDCLLYILKPNETSPSKYKLISDDLYFDVYMPLQILEEKSGGYHKILAVSKADGKQKIFAFDRRKNLYEEK